MILQKYAAALLQVAIIAIGAFSVIPEAELSWVSLAQIAVLVAGAGITYIVPLVDGKWQGALKTGLSAGAALVTAAIPFMVNGSITPTQAAVVALAALNAIASEIGVAMRTENYTARHAVI